MNPQQQSMQQKLLAEQATTSSYAYDVEAGGPNQTAHDSQTNSYIEKAKKPIVWCRLSFGIRIEDLHLPYYEEVIELVKQHYVPDEPTFMSMKLGQDEESLEEFLSYCNVWLHDTCSMVAVEEGEKKAVGVLIGRVVLKKDMDRELSRMSEDEEEEDLPVEKRRRSRGSMRRGSRKSMRRGSKKSIRRGSKKSIRRGSKKSIRRASKKSIGGPKKSISGAKKSISGSKKSIRRASQSRRASKKSIRRQSKKQSMRRQSRRQSKSRRKSLKGRSKSGSKESRESLEKKKKGPETISKFPRPIDRIPRAPKIKKKVIMFDDLEVIYKTDPLKKIQNLRHHVSKSFDIFAFLQKSKYYNVYVLCVHRDYRRKGIGKSLLRCLFGLCRGFRIDVAVGLFPSFISQNMFFKLGGKVGYEIAYKDWVIDEKVVFASTGNHNFSIAFMYLMIPPREEANYSQKVEERPPIPRRAMGDKETVDKDKDTTNESK